MKSLDRYVILNRRCIAVLLNLLANLVPCCTNAFADKTIAQMPPPSLASCMSAFLK
jgi:hypothetical protein